MERAMIWGAGELGGRVAASWVAEGGCAWGFTRTQSRHEHLKACGVEARLGHPLEVLAPDDRLLLALPGSASQAAALETLLSAGVPPPRRAVLISSTGYHGSVAYGRLDADSPAGTDERAQRVVKSERLFREWAGARGVILRCGGLYRRGRGPLSALQTRGRAPLGPPDKTLALVHYDDAASAAISALRHPAPRPIYLVTAKPLPTRQQFYMAACVLLELPLPAFSAPLNKGPIEYDLAPTHADLLPAPKHPRWQGALLP